jgi:thiamine-phosphate pyrophosphorylase
VSLGRLHVLTDARLGPAALAVVAAAVGAGAPAIQVRGKGCTDRELYEFTRRAVGLCAGSAQCIVNDRVDVAVAAGANGVHLGADDLPAAVARRVAGPGPVLRGFVIGGTAREPVTAAGLVADGVDYLGVGPAYATATKSGLPDPIGPAGVGAVARAVGVPVIAIGGVTAERIPELLAAGAYGVAVVGAVSDAADPGAATEKLLRALTSGVAAAVEAGRS